MVRVLFEEISDDFELMVVDDEVRCTVDHVHKTVEPEHFRLMVLAKMVSALRRLLQLTEDFDVPLSHLPERGHRVYRPVDWAKVPQGRKPQRGQARSASVKGRTPEAPA